jgi:predicted RNA-binding protein with PIN domain
MLDSTTLYLFDGYNLLHAGGGKDRRELVDRLASYVAIRGARGVVVFDGVGEDATFGPLQVRYAAHADQLLERLASENRHTARVELVSSDLAVRGTAGQEVGKRAAKEFVRELADERMGNASRAPRSTIEDALDAETREQLERWRRSRP